MSNQWNSDVTCIALKRCIYEDIDDDYGRAFFGPFDLIVDKTTGFFNATEFCNHAISIGETTECFDDWLRTKRSGIMLNLISTTLGVPRKQLLSKRDHLTGQLKGTYAHPQLIVIIANWISIGFQIKAGSIVLNHFARGGYVNQG